MKKAVFTAVFMAAIMMFSSIAIASPGLTVQTDKNEYTIGEDVVVTLMNEWNDYIGTGLGYYVTTTQGDVVWAVGWVEIMVLIPPGGCLEYVWDQTYQNSELGDDFAQVEPGTYIIHGNYGNSRNPIKIVESSDIAFETVDEGKISYVGYGDVFESTFMVIRDDTAWTKFWAEHKSGLLPTPEKPYIDFANEMVIVAIHGTFSSMGADIDIESVEDKNGYWDVDVVIDNWSSPLPAQSNPYHIIKTPYSDQQVKFTVTEI